MTKALSMGRNPSDQVDVPGYSAILITGTSVEPPAVSKLGDVSGDSIISAADALMALRLANGENVTGARRDMADVDCNAVINETDAILILRTAVGELEQPMTCTRSQSAHVTQMSDAKTGTGSGTVIAGAPVASGGQYSVTYTATPSAGSRFAGWEASCSGTTPTCKLTTGGAASLIARARFELVTGGGGGTSTSGGNGTNGGVP